MRYSFKRCCYYMPKSLANYHLRGVAFIKKFLLYLNDPNTVLLVLDEMGIGRIYLFWINIIIYYRNFTSSTLWIFPYRYSCGFKIEERSSPIKLDMYSHNIKIWNWVSIIYLRRRYEESSFCQLFFSPYPWDEAQIQRQKNCYSLR